MPVRMTNFIRIVILLIRFNIIVKSAKNNKLTIDISEDCENNSSTSIYLPYGTGSADARVVLLRSLSSMVRHCYVDVVRPNSEISCKDKCITVVVIEMFNYETLNLFCWTMSDGMFLTFEGKKIGDVCTDINKSTQREHQIYTYIIHEEKFKINIDFKNFSGTIKMTLTSAKYLGNHGNCTGNEIYCVWEGQVFCIDKFLECDGNFNCGTPALYDEYCSNLYVQENILFAIVYGCCLVAVIMFFFVQFLRLCVPTVADHFFVFHEGEQYKFVLTSQSLPPLRLYKSTREEETETEHGPERPTDTQIY